MKRDRPPRIFLGVKEIAGYYGNLELGFQQLGVSATFVPYDAHPFEYDVGRKTSLLVRVIRHSRAVRKKRDKKTRKFWKRIERVASFLYLVSAIPRYDVFIFGFGTSIAQLKDLPWLRRFGKTVIFVFHGSDSRPPYLNGSFMAADRGATLEKCIRKTAESKAALTEIERWADFIVSHPPSSQLHERRIVSWLNIGIPHEDKNPDREELKPSPVEVLPKSESTGRVRILHSPSHPEAKGTPRFREVIESLRGRGHEIDFIEIIRQPHAVVLQELVRCDFVIDQLYSDTPMAGLAVEAAFHSKPTVVGTYAIETLHDFVTEAEFPPTQLCHPDDIEKSVEQLITNVSYRRDLGRKAYDFVHERWSSRKVAERYMQMIHDEVPDEWLIDPNQIDYMHGFGSSEQVVQERVRTLCDKFGKDVLQLGDKPEFEAQLLEFAYRGAGQG